MAAAIATTRAFAHRPNESTAELRWEHARLEGELVLSVPLASILLADPEIPLITAENFPAVRPRLQKRLAESFVVSAHDKPVAPAPLADALSFTAEGDIRCALIFPIADSSPVQVHAVFLERASSDSFCWLRVWQSADRLLAQKLLVRSAPRSALPAAAP